MAQISTNVVTFTCDSKKFIVCCQEVKETGYILIRLTDGQQMWKHEEKMRSDKEHKITWGNLNTDLKVTKEDDRLDILTSKGNLLWSVSPVANNDNADELKNMLFFLADHASDLQTRYCKLNQANLELSSKGNSNYSLTNLDSHKKGLPTKARPKDGMSIINPMSKRIKVSQGVTFD